MYEHYCNVINGSTTQNHCCQNLVLPCTDDETSVRIKHFMENISKQRNFREKLPAAFVIHNESTYNFNSNFQFQKFVFLSFLIGLIFC